MTQTAFLFDLDGTLVDSVYQHILAWHDALMTEDIDLPIWLIHQRIGMSDGLIINEFLRISGRVADAQLTTRLIGAHSNAYKKLASTVKPLPGARELLQYLDTVDMPWAIATSGDVTGAMPNLSALGLDPDAITLVTRNEADLSKPDPDLFIQAAAKLGVPIDDTIVIGDSQWDMLAAARCGALGVGLLCGGNGADDLQRSGAIRLYADPSALLQNINELAPRAI